MEVMYVVLEVADYDARVLLGSGILQKFQKN
jgi:hypothetical protein